MSLYSQLYDWQKKIVDFAATKKSYGLFLDMGLGKTIQALALAEVLNAEKIIVITKKSKACETVETPGSWQYWGSKIAGFEVLPKKKPAFRESAKQIYITNYEAVFDRTPGKKGVSLKPEIMSLLKACRHQPVTLLLDESHCIKDSSTTQAKALLQLKRELMCYSSDLHTYLLTGTPFTSGFIDIYNQLKFMGCPMTKTEFKDRFCKLGNIRGLLGWQQPIVSYKNIPRLYDLIHEYAITMKSEDVVKLPDKIFTTHFSPPAPIFDYLTQEKLTAEELARCAHIRAQAGLQPLPPGYSPLVMTRTKVLNPWYRNIGYPDNRWLCDTPALLWLRARELSIGFQGNGDDAYWLDRTRMQQIESFLADNPGNYVLFYNYVPEFFELFAICERLGYHIDCYNGDVKSLYFYEKFSRQSAEERVVNQKNVILANFASGSVGMNWQLYNRCLIASLPLYKDWAQGLKRVHRVGSTETVEYHVFMGDNWLDRDMWDALQSGTEYSQEMFNKKLNTVQI